MLDIRERNIGYHEATPRSQAGWLREWRREKYWENACPAGQFCIENVMRNTRKDIRNSVRIIKLDVEGKMRTEGNLAGHTGSRKGDMQRSAIVPGAQIE